MSDIQARGVRVNNLNGYLAFDKDWNLLVPFRTWQNTITGPAAAELTECFHFNVPQRWSVAHLSPVFAGHDHRRGAYGQRGPGRRLCDAGRLDGEDRRREAVRAL